MYHLVRLAAVSITALLIAPGASAQSQQPMIFNAFSLDKLIPDSFTPNTIPLKVLSDSAGVTTIGIDTWQQMGLVKSGGAVVIGEYNLSMQLTALPGYQITGFSFSGDLAGVLEPAPHGGTAINYANTYLDVYGLNGKKYASSTFGLVGLNGASNFVLDSNGTVLPDVMTLSLEGFASARGEYGYISDINGGVKIPSYASIGMSNTVLTIYSAALPVPEPGTWLMLLAGLGLILPYNARRFKMANRQA